MRWPKVIQLVYLNPCKSLPFLHLTLSERYEAATRGFPGAVAKGFKIRAEALAFIERHSPRQGPAITVPRVQPSRASAPGTQRPPVTVNRAPPVTVNRAPPVTANREPPVTVNREPPVTMNRGPPVAMRINEPSLSSFIGGHSILLELTLRW
jgi:hypothetical protein